MSVRKKKHDWNRLQNYISVHQSVLKKYESCFTNNPQYRIERITDQMMEMSVTMLFAHKNLKLEIEKTAEVRVYGKGLEVARTFSYSYAVSDQIGCLFRYCSPHASHNKYHHQHVYDLVTRKQTNPPVRIDADEFPHIDEVIEEVLKQQ